MVSKYLSIIGGLIAIVLGVVGLINWWEDYIVGFLKSGLVIILLLGGLLAVFAGIGEIKDSLEEKKEKQ
ncbi:MAG: hypothetical protein PHX64_05375 [Candidatus Omnitrophica bacterium]|nr:hypothetical protein [Candidatus Omnitrophota bacterium]MDD5311162.1 hypothetical protein [Candidatus Omnitrophota bacterium]MDD5546921.1 hypothetical protein [Candidatus Omnitrophota bacterium]